ncbi:Phenylacetic acid degradation-like protein [gamma proteobacterium HdN1]|nr:Phenylacetic acid degradation-like protein [gamma proteobacterium HdN1]
MEQTASAPDGIDYKQLVARFMNNIRHGKALGFQLVEASRDGVTVRLPYKEDLVGNPTTGVIHGGAITALLDESCGMAVAAAIAPEMDITPTIDLRIDYMRPAEPHRDIFAYTHVYRLSKSVAFARGVAYQDHPDKPIAHCVATFIRMGMKGGYLAPKGAKPQGLEEAQHSEPNAQAAADPQVLKDRGVE